MAALGAGAGAHKGEMDSRAIAQREVEGEQAHQRGMMAIEQNDQHFKMNFGQRESELEKVSERTDRLDKRQEERDTFDRERLIKSDEWADVLNKLMVEQKEQQLVQSNLTLTAYREAAQAEKDQIAKREEIAKSNFGALVISALENGGVAPLANINLHNNAVGSKFTGAYFTPDGGFVVDEKGEDGQVKSNYHEQSIVNAVKSYFFNEPLQRTSGRVSSSGSARMAPSSFSTTPDVAQQRIDMQQGENYLKNLERRIDALKEDLKEYPDLAAEKNIKEEIKKLRKRHDDVSNKVYGKYYIDDDKGGGKGGGKVPTFVNSVVERLYGMTAVELSDRLRKIAEAQKQSPDAILFGILKGETEENKKAFFKSLK